MAGIRETPEYIVTRYYLFPLSFDLLIICGGAELGTYATEDEVRILISSIIGLVLSRVWQGRVEVAVF